MTDHIGVFMPSLRGGGAERTMAKLAASFVAEGTRVDLVLTRAEGPYLEEVPREVRIVDLAASRVLASMPGLVRYLRRERPATLISVMDHANIIAVWARSLARVQANLVVTERDVGTEDDGRRGLRLKLALIRQFYPRADGIVAVSHGVARYLASVTGLPRDRIRVIYNPVVTPELAQRAREAVDHPWFAPEQPPVVLAAGRLTRQKDFPTLIRAFERLVHERPARLMILGEGQDRGELEALIRAFDLSEQVSLPGFVSNPYGYMSRAAVFALSSAWEGLPGALIEAMACGCPVVSTDCESGPREILEDGRWGRLVPVGDPAALAEALRDALEAPPPPVPAAALDRFTPAHAVRQYRALCQACHAQ